MPKTLAKKANQVWKLMALSLVIGLTGCTQAGQNLNSGTTPATTEASRPKVVVTTSLLCDITKEIAQDTIDLACLIKPGQDPHAYQPQPSDRKAIEDAQLILYGGYAMEPEVINLIEATKNSSSKVAVYETAVPQPIMAEAHHHEEEHAEEPQGKKGAEVPESGKAPDPHIWHDAKNGVRIVTTVREQLETLAPNHADLYARNAQAMTAEFNQLDKWIQSQIATIPADQRRLVTTHDAFSYYGAAYSLEVEPLQGISTEERPTAAQVKQLAQTIQGANVPTIFAETTHNPKTIQAVAREAQVKVSAQELFPDGPGEPGTEAATYRKMLIANTRAIVEGLGGQYTPFQAQASSKP